MMVDLAAASSSVVPTEAATAESNVLVVLSSASFKPSSSAAMAASEKPTTAAKIDNPNVDMLNIEEAETMTIFPTGVSTNKWQNEALPKSEVAAA